MRQPFSNLSLSFTAFLTSLRLGSSGCPVGSPAAPGGPAPGTPLIALDVTVAGEVARPLPATGPLSPAEIKRLLDWTRGPNFQKLSAGARAGTPRFRREPTLVGGSDQARHRLVDGTDDEVGTGGGSPETVALAAFEVSLPQVR